MRLVESDPTCLSEDRYEWVANANEFRIEDNLLITKDGSINLTDAIKDPDELEKIISAS